MTLALNVKRFHTAMNNVFRSSIKYVHRRFTNGKFKLIKLTFRDGATFTGII